LAPIFEMDRGALIQCALFLPDSGACVHGPCLSQSLAPLPVRVQDDLVPLEGPTAQPIGAYPRID